jgi:hypothetical protein
LRDETWLPEWSAGLITKKPSAGWRGMETAMFGHDFRLCYFLCYFGGKNLALNDDAKEAVEMRFNPINQC